MTSHTQNAQLNPFSLCYSNNNSCLHTKWFAVALLVSSLVLFGSLAIFGGLGLFDSQWFTHSIGTLTQQSCLSMLIAGSTVAVIGGLTGLILLIKACRDGTTTNQPVNTIQFNNSTIPGNTENVVDKAALYRAIKNQDVETVKNLIQAGVDVNCLDSDVSTANVRELQLCGRRPLHEAIAVNNKEIIQTLIENKADVNLGDFKGNLPIYDVITRTGDLEIIDILLTNGAGKLNNGMTALHLFARYSLSEEADEGFKIFKKHSANLNAKDNDGWTPLHYAARFRNARLVQVLIEQGADKTIQANDGQRPLDVASTRRENEAVIQILENKQGN